MTTLIAKPDWRSNQAMTLALGRGRASSEITFVSTRYTSRPPAERVRPRSPRGDLELDAALPAELRAQVEELAVACDGRRARGQALVLFDAEDHRHRLTALLDDLRRPAFTSIPLCDGASDLHALLSSRPALG